VLSALRPAAASCSAEEAREVGARLGLHAGGDFLGEEFEQEVRHWALRSPRAAQKKKEVLAHAKARRREGVANTRLLI
jgi:hypothetical protein